MTITPSKETLEAFQEWRNEWDAKHAGLGAKAWPSEREIWNAAVMQSKEVPQWQPIETAPRDGTVILGFQSNEKYPLAIKWVDYEGWSGWVYADEMLMDFIPEPTHWMPLPNPPTNEAENE